MPTASKTSADQVNSRGHQVPRPSVKTAKARSHGARTLTCACATSGKSLIVPPSSYTPWMPACQPDLTVERMSEASRDRPRTARSARLRCSVLAPVLQGAGAGIGSITGERYSNQALTGATQLVDCDLRHADESNLALVAEFADGAELLLEGHRGIDPRAVATDRSCPVAGGADWPRSLLAGAPGARLGAHRGAGSAIRAHATTSSTLQVKDLA